MSDNMKRSLLPDFLNRTIVIPFVFIIPQIILLLINLRAFWIIKEEVAPDKIPIAYSILVMEIALLLLVSFIGWWIKLHRTQLSLGWNIVFFLTHIGYLWYVSSYLFELIPSQIELWVLNTGDLILYQFTFVMPGLFYAGLRLACFEVRLKAGVDFGMTLAMAVIAPLLYYLLFVGFARFWVRPAGWYLPGFLSTLFFIGITTLTYLGLVRLIVLTYNWIRLRGDWAQVLFAGLIGLAGPMAGLQLNRWIPFPADFQTPWVYVLAVINGLIVLIPSIKKSTGHGYLLFARSLMYPFTFYFFLVFLPFLPLSLPAIFALGSGFLILVPCVLFLLHTKRWYEDFKECLAASGGVLAVVVSLLGFTILPLYFTVEALRDKVALREALRYAYSPDYTTDVSFAGSVNVLKRTLLNLKEFKEGIQLPYLSQAYEKLVFEGMVLPDSKIEYLYRLFSGEDLSMETRQGRWGRGLFFRAPIGTRPRPIDQQVELTFVEVNQQTEGEITKARLRLTMQNKGSSNNAEFFKEIRIPEGVLITGFQLKIGKDMVPAQIFEKRAALWIYHMIRDFTQRDPGLLVYQSPTLAELRIYPFLLNETREAEVEFQFPKGLTPQMMIGDQAVELIKTQGIPPVSSIISVPGSHEELFYLFPEENIRSFPKLKRQPYLHFILDFSKDSYRDLERFKELMDSVIDQFKEVKLGKITVANFEIQDLSDEFIPLNDKDKIREILKKSQLPHRGSLDLGRVIKQKLIEYESDIKQGWGQYPLFVVITKSDKTMFATEDIEFYKSILPDTDYYLLVMENNSIAKKLLWPKGSLEKDKEVIILKVGDRAIAIPAESEGIQVAHFKDIHASDPLSVYDQLKGTFLAINEVKKLSRDSSYTQGLDLFLNNQSTQINPLRLKQKFSGFVNQSRKLGVLIPSTAFIVVERSSQWKTLALKESQRLKTLEGLEFEEEFETPAPSVWVLLLILMIWELTKRVRERIGRYPVSQPALKMKGGDWI